MSLYVSPNFSSRDAHALAKYIGRMASAATVEQDYCFPANGEFLATFRFHRPNSDRVNLGVLAWGEMGVRALGDQDEGRIRGKIARAYAKIRPLGLPNTNQLHIVLIETDGFLDNVDFGNVLFGKEVLLCTSGAIPRATRLPNGLLRPSCYKALTGVIRLVRSWHQLTAPYQKYLFMHPTHASLAPTIQRHFRIDETITPEMFP